MLVVAAGVTTTFSNHGIHQPGGVWMPGAVMCCAPPDEAILTARAYSYRGEHRDVVRAIAFEL